MTFVVMREDLLPELKRLATNDKVLSVENVETGDEHREIIVGVEIAQLPNLARELLANVHNW